MAEESIVCYARLKNGIYKHVALHRLEFEYPFPFERFDGSVLLVEFEGSFTLF